MIRGFLLGVSVTTLTICLVGCSAKSGSPQAGSGGTAAVQTAAAPKEPLTPEQEKAFSELPPADRAAAEKQAICPVSDEKLGTMGAPYKVTVAGSDGTQHDVYLCCDGCEKDLKSDPDKYLAKLPK